MLDCISISNIITVLVALFGWLFVHWLSKSREIEAARRNLRASYLMEAYRSIENSIKRNLQNDDKRQLERAAADIELLGNKEQIALVHDLVVFSMENPRKEGEILDRKFKLLDNLRMELRGLFKQDATQLEKRVVLRLENNSANNNQ
ncbi:hypothetical protein SAMN05421881_11303 [Nitrosomonas halophila]|uniref:Uncharacterized protein n=1 Tax=Nitrosomonas halophila TaxID=44576 RepID=A0A1H3Q3S1_9PROT|nr:hypothetical protein SAMN05421881_11303 [Nitrosomonas halophila]